MIEIEGPWLKGYSFAIHTINSVYTGDNQFGHPTFDTTRSPMGQCLYELKYGQHLPVIDKIVELLVEDREFCRFIRHMDVLLPVPPSNTYRRIQPVTLVSTKISERYKKNMYVDILSSANKEELKNIPTEQKYEKIKKAIKLVDGLERKNNILVIDDVFDSGSTLSAITNVLNEKGYDKVFVFTLTKTRKAD